MSAPRLGATEGKPVARRALSGWLLRVRRESPVALIIVGMIIVTCAGLCVALIVKVYGVPTLIALVAAPFLALGVYNGAKYSAHGVRRSLRVWQARKQRVPEQNDTPQTRTRELPEPTPPRAPLSCPYCAAELRTRKPPKRRSSFKCPACGESVQVDPHQWLYPSPYLTEEQAGYVRFLWQLDRWVFTRGSRKDYERMQAQLRKKFGDEPGIGDVIWGLMNLSCSDCAEHQAKETRELARLFSDDPGYVKEQTKFHPELDDVRAFMAEFRVFERQMKAERRQRGKTERQ